MTHEETAAFMATLKVGSEFAISHRASISFHKVERETPTQLIAADGRGEVRVRKKDGCIVGEGYQSAIPVTQELRDKAELSALRSWAWNLDRQAQNMTIDQLRRIKAIVEETGKVPK